MAPVRWVDTQGILTLIKASNDTRMGMTIAILNARRIPRKIEAEHDEEGPLTLNDDCHDALISIHRENESDPNGSARILHTDQYHQ